MIAQRLFRRRFAPSKCFRSIRLFHASRSALKTGGEPDRAFGLPWELSKYEGKRVRKHKLSSPLKLELGGSIEDCTIAYEVWGQGDDVLLLFPSLSMSSHAKSSAYEPHRGWWETLIGPHRGICTEKFKIICPANIGSPFGSSSPLTVNPATGEPYGSTFPVITPMDLASAAHRLIVELGHAEGASHVVGASLGGLSALCYAAAYASDEARVAAIHATPRTSPGSVALRHVQRDAVRRDPHFHGGNYRTTFDCCLPNEIIETPKSTQAGAAAHEEEVDAYAATIKKSAVDGGQGGGKGAQASQKQQQQSEPTGLPCAGPINGMALARQLGMITYRSIEEFDSRFVWEAEKPCQMNTLCWDVEGYLMHKSKSFNNFDANCYLALSKCADLMDLSRGHNSYVDGLSQINCKLLLMAVQEDIIIPCSQSVALAHILRSMKKDVKLVTHSSLAGHDAFLTDDHVYAPIIQHFLENVEEDYDEMDKKTQV